MAAMRPLALLITCPLISSCWLTPQDRDCYGGLELDGLYEIRVIEQWSEDSQFVWPPYVQDLVSSPSACNGEDGLVAGTSFRIRLVQRRYPPGDTSCHLYVGVPVAGITGVDFTAPRILEGPFSAFVFTPDGYHYGIQTWTLLDNPVGIPARPGEPAPIALLRGALCGTDLFAAEMHRVPEPLDASIDAHSLDAGGVEQ